MVKRKAEISEISSHGGSWITFWVAIVSGAFPVLHLLAHGRPPPHAKRDEKQIKRAHVF